MINAALLEMAEYTIARHEGCVSHVYEDSEGFWTIGYGRCVDVSLGGGITEEEASMLLSNDIKRIHAELTTAFRWYPRLDTARQAGLINMAYNLGLPRLLTFRKMIAHLEHGEFDRAAEECLDSKWARQVGRRAEDIAGMIRGP